MDFMKIAFTCLTGMAMLHATEAGCAEDILNDNEFKTCLEEYSTYARNAIQSSGTGGPGGQDVATKMVGIMCSTEGQAAMACMHPFIGRCEDLTKDARLSDFAGLAKMGGVTEVCKQLGGNSCMAVTQCFGQADFEGSTDSSMADPETTFGMYQLQIQTLCGPVKHQIDCMKGKEKECPHIMEQMESMLEMGRKQATPGTAFGDYQTIAMFVTKECPNFPTDFGTNKCVKDKLTAPEFKECFVNSTRPYSSTSEIGCDAYKAGYSCVPKAIDSCGKKYTHVFTITTNMFLKVTDKDCKLDMEDTSDSNVVQMSSAIIFSSFLLAYISFK